MMDNAIKIHLDASNIGNNNVLPVILHLNCRMDLALFWDVYRQIVKVVENARLD